MNIRTFCIDDSITFRETEINNGVFEKSYELINPAKNSFLSIPDGTIDIQCVWKDGTSKIQICGSFVQGGTSGIGEYERCLGIRFHVGSIPKCFRENIDNIINNREDIGNYVSAYEIEKFVNRGITLDEFSEYFMNRFCEFNTDEHHYIIEFIVDKIYKNSGNINVSQIIEELGYCHRHTDRVFKDNIGFSIKKYANIVRMQTAIDCLCNRQENDIYEKLGYYDQAHFIHEFKKFTSLTPNKFKKISQKINVC